MKLKKIAFLFFCVLILTQNIYSKQTIDSLKYHTDLIKKQKGASNLLKAYRFLQKDKEVSLETNQIIRAAYELDFISRIEYSFGAYYNSEKSAIEGLTLLDSLSKDESKPYRIGLLNDLGKVKRSLNSYEESLFWYKEMLNLSSSNNEKGVVHNNIGVLYMYQGKDTLALDQFQKAYYYNKKTNYKRQILKSLDNLGFVQSRLNIADGLINMKKALAERKKIDDSSLYASYKHLIEHYTIKKDKKSALYYAKKGYQFAKKYNNESILEVALLNLIDLKENQYALEYKNVVQSIKEKRLKEKNEFAAAKYNLGNEQLKTKKAELEKEKEKSKRIESDTKANRNLFIALSILLISFFVYYILRIRYKKGKLQERYAAERQISKKLHDEVANTVFYTMSKQQNKPNLDIELIDDLEEIYLKTRDISKTSAALKITKNFDNDLKDLVLSYKTDVVNIFTRNLSDMPWHTLSDLKKETIYRVLQELMTNMRKHSKASLVSLQFTIEKKKIIINYTDNGVGTALKKSNGLQNVESRMKEVGGTVTFESETNKGFQVKMTM